MAKATIYIDSDEDITGVIDKVVSADEKVVALVLPKRANLFQSTVNLKLIQKAAKKAKKSLVLISSDPALTAAAAVGGVHIAKTLTSKPAVPKKAAAEKVATIDTEELDISDASAEVADEDSTATAKDEPIELDNTSAIPEDVVEKKDKKDKKKFKIPDFRSFKVRSAIGIALVVLLVVGWIFGFIILPKATVTIDTDTQRLDITTDFRADTSQDSIDLEEAILPATLVEYESEDSATVEATGEKDVGEEATGTLTLTNCRQGAAGVTIPEGTGFSADGKTFSTNSAVELGPAVFVGDDCISADFPAFGAVADVGVTANEPGEDYNIAAQSYNSPTSGVSAFGSEMTGGTSKVVTVVSSDDIKKAEDQLSGAATAEALTRLRANLQEQNKQSLDETLEESDTKTTYSAASGDEADEVTVRQTVVYSLLGVSNDDLNSLLNKTIEDQINDPTRNIRDNGLSGAVYQGIDAKNESDQTLRLQTVATIGQIFDEEAIKQDVAGKRRGEIEALLGARDGVRDVNVEYSPFWVTTTPKSADKITIVINEVE